MFSSRLPERLSPNALALAAGRRRASGDPIFDLTESNPTAVGLAYPRDWLAALADARAACYRPEPFGAEEARAAVAASYAGGKSPVDPGAVILTASTSEAYAVLFKLLADPGDEVLVPQPSYPLFELLTSLEAVKAVPYRLDPAAAWSLDRESLESGLTARTRAVLVVSPNNPTGSRLRRADREWLVERVAEHRIALIADEVFADYLVVPRPDAVSLVGEARVLTFALGGLSKSAGLPQVKLAWTVMTGPAALVRAARTRLEVITDTYLSVSTPVQLAAARLLEVGHVVRGAIQTRLATNFSQLRAVIGRHPSLTLLAPEGGWSAVLRIPAIRSEEATVLGLLEEAHVLVHPGYFFDFAAEAYLVVSLLPDPTSFREAAARLAAYVAGVSG